MKKKMFACMLFFGMIASDEALGFGLMDVLLGVNAGGNAMLSVVSGVQAYQLFSVAVDAAAERKTRESGEKLVISGLGCVFLGGGALVSGAMSVASVMGLLARR